MTSQISHKIAIAGGAGYIGSVLTKTMLENGHKVTVFDRLFFGDDALEDVKENPNLEIKRADVRDITAEDLKGFDIVCDLAALSNDPSGEIDPELTYDINHKGRINFAKSAKEAGVKRYILASSCSVYGAGKENLLTEETKVNPLTAYAESNVFAENDLLAMADDNFCVTAMRNATVFGLSGRMRFDLIINIMTLHAFEKGRIVVLGGGQQWRPLVHVKDVCRGFESIMNADTKLVNKEIFNIGCDNYKVRTVASIIRETLPFKVDIDIAPDDADKRNYNVSFDKIGKVLGYKAKYDIDYGIKEIYEALKYGRLENTPKTVTVKWYQSILEAQKIVDRVTLNGRLI